MSKGEGGKIAIKFDRDLTGDISGLATPVGWKVGDDIATGAVAITAGSTRSSPTYDPDKALDRDNATSWQPSYRNLTWLKIDMGEPVEAKGWGMRTPAADGYPLSYRIEGSNDDSNWDVLLTVTLESVGYGADVLKEFTEVETYRYWQIVVTARIGNFPGLAEFYLYEKAPAGNELAFTVTGRPLGPGLMPEREYPVDSVEPHPTLGADHILLTMDPINNPDGGRFCNVDGSLTVAYDSGIGTLAGAGGPVLSFEESFTPADLEPVGPGYRTELLDVSIVNYDIRNILPDPGYLSELLEVGITNYSLYLIDPEDP